MVVRRRDTRGRLKVQGGPRLKQSQQYPDAFGQALQQLHQPVLERHPYVLKAAINLAMKPLLEKPDSKLSAPLAWKHAKLIGLRVFLARAARKGDFHRVR
ncbi:unnamed protein product [Effrenium voratum]|nr:unnamed protein product [Effrenium voratum]